jgi:hypothetical protein
MRLAKYACVILGFLILTAESVYAQPVPSRDPSSTHVFPAGGRRGSTVQVLVGGECIPPETGFRIYGGGVTGPERLGSKTFARLEPSPRRDPREIPICYPKEWQANVEIASDAALGPRLWRLTCARGGTGSRPFIVGELPEFIETESNSLPDRAERVEMPVTINGRIAGESDLDYFVFTATRGDLVVCDMVAGRIGSPLDAVVEFTDGSGGRVGTTELRIGADPIVALRAPSTGEYRMLVSNVGFYGSPAHVYRATLFAIGDLSGVALPDVWPQLLKRGLIPSVAPCHATTEPDSVRAAATAGALLDLPTRVRGQFRSEPEARPVRVHAARDEVIEISCRAIPHGIASLPVVTVLDMAGKAVAKCQSSDSPSRECRIDWRATQDGEYRILVDDVWQGGAPALAVAYELTVRRATPDFKLTLKSDFANVIQGSRLDLEVKAHRMGGFAGPIELIALGLPADVRAEPAIIAENQDTAKITVVAQEKARPTDVEFRILGRAKLGDTPVERSATTSHLGRDLHGVAIGTPESTSCFLTVQHKPVFRLFCNEAYQYAYRGTIYPYTMQVERLGDFDEAITVQLGDRQNRDLDGIEFFEVTIPPGANETRVPIYLPESMHINVLSQSQIYAQAYAFFTDKWGQRQSTLVVSEKRNMIRTMPTVAKLQSVDRELTARRGSTVTCRLVLDRTSNFTGPVEVELVEPPGSAGFAAAKGRIEAGAQEVAMAVHVPLDRDTASDPVLRFQARGQLAGDVTVVSETTVPLRIVE